MSNLSRKEFKELLTEWNQNFLNEKFNPNFKEKIKKITSQNKSENKIPEFDIIHVNAEHSDEIDEVGLTEFRDPQSDLYKKINKFITSNPGYSHDIMYVNTDECRNEILNYLFNKKCITQDEFSRINNLGKNKDIMIIFESGDVETWHLNSGDTTYNDVAYNLHDTFHMLFDFNKKSRTNILKDFIGTTEFDDYIIEKLSFEDIDKLIDYVNKKLSMNQTKKYAQHNITSEDFFPSFMSFVYLYVFNDSNISSSIDNLSKKDEFNILFSDPVAVKEIILSCTQELKKYIDNVNNDNTKYIYINLTA